MNCTIVNVRTSNLGTKSHWVNPNTVYVYCGRPSRLGNPYVVGRDGNRDEVIRKCWNDQRWLRSVQEFLDWLRTTNAENVILGCWCAPKRCHTEYIARLVAALK